jgi:hypothetical protein
MFKSVVIRRLGIVSFGLVFISLGNLAAPAAPIYKTASTIGESTASYSLTDFNNEDDILGLSGDQGPFIYHFGVLEILPTQGAPEISSQGSVPNAMNNADANGVVRIVGEAWVFATNGVGDNVSTRGACWLVQSNTSAGIVEETMPNNLTVNGEANEGSADAVNDAGEATGIGVGFWAPDGYTYGNAQWGAYANSPVGGGLGLDDFGNYFELDWSWDQGLASAHLAPLIGPTAGELPDVDSASGTNAEPMRIHGGFVVGWYWGLEPRLIGTVSNGQAERAYVWSVGDARLTQLPDLTPPPAGFSGTSVSSEAQSVNNSGDVVGWVEYPTGAIQNGYLPGIDFLVLWKRNPSGGYAAYNLSDIIADQDASSSEVFGNDNPPLINDKDEIAMETHSYFSPFNIEVLVPTGGAITVSGSNVVDQTAKFAVATVSLQRADNYTGLISVHYGTSDGTAIAGIRYTNVSGTLTWNTGDSSNKVIQIPLISIHTGVPYEDFNFTLSNPTNATFGGYGDGSNLDINITDDGGTFTFGSTNYSVADDWTNVTLTVNRTNGTDGAATIGFETYDDTAISGTDYTATNGTLSWASGDTSSRQITIPIASIGTGTNVDFDVYLYVQSADSGSAQIGAGEPTIVTITRPGHPVQPTIEQFSAGTVSKPTLSFQLNATQGGIFDVLSMNTVPNNGSWTTNFTFTNTFGNLVIPNGFSISVRGRFYKLHAR